VRRYGFHGLSYQYIAAELAQLEGGIPPRTIIAHLGNGASLCALRDGQSIATSMGFSTLDGLLMGTRCGSLDPGVILHLLRDGMDTASLTDLLYNQSGLQGISGLSADMRTLLASDRSAARQAVEQFCYTLVRQIGSHAAALQGLDCLVFTGGIGERAAAIRERVCAQLSWLGLQIDTTANQQQAGLISGSSSRVAIRVIPTNEERVIARHTLELLA
jgi:acetate kinase